MAVTIREARCGDEAGIARVHVESWRTTYRGIVPQDFLDGLSMERRAEMWRRSLCEGLGDGQREAPFVFVVEEDNEITGFASGSRTLPNDSDFAGELQAMYLLADRQRRSAGRRLVGCVARRMQELEMTSMLLWVLAENTPARRFYEGLGGIAVRSQLIELGVQLEEIAYGWADLAALTAL